MNIALSNLASGIKNLGRNRLQNVEAINSDIDEELSFHIDCRFDELLNNGMERNEARRQAEADFGSLDQVRKNCQKINYGNRVWVSRLIVVGLVVALSAIGWLTFQLVSVNNLNSELASQLQATANAVSPTFAPPVKQDKSLDIGGVITDSEGNAIEDATVILILKTWPGNRFKMDNFATTTDEDGKYVFEGAYRKAGGAEILVSVLADGYLLTSKYVTKGPRKSIKSGKFKLREALQKTIQVVDENGDPLANAKVAVSGRDPKRGKEQMIYAASYPDVTFETDDDGKVELGFFEAGDKAKIYVEDLGKTLVLRIDDKPEQALSLGGAKIVGTVVDMDGDAIQDAKVILSLKSWPNNRFRMDSYSADTDSDGKFKFPPTVDAGVKCEFMITVLADGYQMEGEYVENPKGKEVAAFSFKLGAAIKKTFLLKGSDELEAARVFVKSRVPSDSKDKRFSLFPVSAGPTTKSVKADNTIEFNYFVEGDKIELAVNIGGAIKTVEIIVDGEEVQTVDISKKKQKQFRE